MGERLDLIAADGHRLGAYRADPEGQARGAVVVVQEIFGINHHIRSVCDGFAADGYVAIAPAVFDRVQRDVELGYSPDDIKAGLALRQKLEWDTVLADTAASIANVAPAGRVGIVGYCYGGGVAYAAACRLTGLSAAVGYYGGPLSGLIDEVPNCPVMLHFAEQDNSVPIALADDYKAKHPAIVVHRYAAQHGFSCDPRPSYDAFAHYKARARTLAFFAATLD